MRGKRGLSASKRAMGAREAGKQTGGEAGQFQEGSERTRRAASRGGHASKGTRRPRKSDI